MSERTLYPDVEGDLPGRWHTGLAPVPPTPSPSRFAVRVGLPGNVSAHDPTAKQLRISHPLAFLFLNVVFFPVQELLTQGIPRAGMNCSFDEGSSP
jgi:hypothetical protein